MSFPRTKHTLIARVASGGSDSDWSTFLADYWGPVCRFAGQRGRLTIEEAEDVASLAFEAVLRNQLLARWVANRSAKLRTLLCSVVRNVVSNRARIMAGRQRILREQSARLMDPELLSLLGATEPTEEQADVFYAGWVQEVVQQAAQSLFHGYHADGKGDYFRVLYSRICDGMTSAEIAAALDLPLHAVENFYRHAKNRLSDRLKELVQVNVERYCDDEDVASEFQVEWSRLGEYLATHGGLEESIRRLYEGASAMAKLEGHAASRNAAARRLTDILHLTSTNNSTGSSTNS